MINRIGKHPILIFFSPDFPLIFCFIVNHWLLNVQIKQKIIISLWLQLLDTQYAQARTCWEPLLWVMWLSKNNVQSPIKERKPCTSFERAITSFQSTVRIKLQTLITDLSTKGLGSNIKRTSFIKGSAARASVTFFFFEIVTFSQKLILLKSDLDSCSHQ